MTYRPRGAFLLVLTGVSLALACFLFITEPPGADVSCVNAAHFSEEALSSLSETERPAWSSMVWFVCTETPVVTIPGILGPRKTSLSPFHCIDGGCEPQPDPPLMLEDVQRAADAHRQSFRGTAPWQPFLGALSFALTMLALALRPFAWRLTFSASRGAFDAIHLSEHFRAKLGALHGIALEPRAFGRQAIVVLTEHPDRRQVLHTGWLGPRDRLFVAEARAALTESRDPAAS